MKYPPPDSGVILLYFRKMEINVSAKILLVFNQPYNKPTSRNTAFLQLDNGEGYYWTG